MLLLFVADDDDDDDDAGCISCGVDRTQSSVTP